MQQFPFSLKLSFSFQSKEKAGAVLGAVIPDIGKRKHLRSRTELEAKGEKLCLKILAKDPTALRASFNSAMKPIVFSDKLFKTFPGEK